MYRGVYRVGHRAPGLESDYMAAVRACGGGAVWATGRPVTFSTCSADVRPLPR